MRRAVDDTSNEGAADGEPEAVCDVFLVTDNVKDLAKVEMATLNVKVVTSGSFLNQVWRFNPEASAQAVIRAAKDLKKPPYTVPELLFALRRQKATSFVDGVAKRLGVVPVERTEVAD